MDEYLSEIEEIIFRSRYLEEGSQTDPKLAAKEIIRLLKEKGYGEVSYLQVA